jgi:hypothetical protein
VLVGGTLVAGANRAEIERGLFLVSLEHDELETVDLLAVVVGDPLDDRAVRQIPDDEHAVLAS